jgi:hypothetical protein
MLAVPRILFVSESCLLDRKSGAAQSVRAQLQALAQAGWEAQAVTMALFDGEAEYDRTNAHPQLRAAPVNGSEVTVDDGDLQHTLYWTHSSRHKAKRPWDLRQYLALAQTVLDRFNPDVVLTYSSHLLRPVLAQAQQRGAHTVFYFGTARCLSKRRACAIGRPTGRRRPVQSKCASSSSAARRMNPSLLDIDALN